MKTQKFWQRWTLWRVMFQSPKNHNVTARALMTLFLHAIRLLPVAITAQICGIGVIFAMLWGMHQWKVFLVIWSILAFTQTYFWIAFVRGFWRDRHRVERIRVWIRRWTALAVFAGVIWGIAGSLFLGSVTGLLQVMTVAVIVAVTFASWPVYSCWMPSLTIFTFLSLTPMTVSVAVLYGVSRLIIVLVVLAVIGFILYSGRRLNEIMLSSILMDMENQRLVERLKLEINRAETARRLMQSESERRAKFFAAANHDLRQPLQAMGIYLDILERRATEQTKPVIKELSLTSASIATLVEQILEVTRLEFGKLETHEEIIDLEAFLTELGNEARSIAESKRLILRVKAQKLCVKTDRVLLRRALNNLLSNAIRYTTTPGATVTIGTRRIGQMVSIGIYDEGPGMTPEDRRRLCETFFRGQAGRSQPGSGFGLGLSIVRGICRELNMELRVLSREGRGSVFSILLPSVDQASGEVESPATQLGHFKPLEGTVYLLEDNRMLLDAIRVQLESWGLVAHAYSKVDAHFYEAIKSNALHDKRVLLLSDYNLGDEALTGLEVAGQLCQVHAVKIPMVLLTAVSHDLIESHYDKMKREGVPRPDKLPMIVQKPVTPQDLNRVLAQFLSE